MSIRNRLDKAERLAAGIRPPSGEPEMSLMDRIEEAARRYDGPNGFEEFKRDRAAACEKHGLNPMLSAEDIHALCTRIAESEAGEYGPEEFDAGPAPQRDR
jgi:hypothetical protein